MKAILMSIKPKWVAKILNGEKTIDVRKTAPKCELPIDVYVYCTEGNGNLWRSKSDRSLLLTRVGGAPYTLIPLRDAYDKLNGKVVAKFTMRKVEDVLLVEGPYPCDALRYDCRTRTLIPSEFYDRSCLLPTEVTGYGNGRKVHAWHISDLVIFDEPKELDGFDYPNPSGTRYVSMREINGLPSKKHPPQSWCYSEEKQ